MVDVRYASVHIFVDAVLVEVRLERAGEFARPVLEPDAAFPVPCRADKDVIEAVLVEVCDGQRRSFGGEHVGDQWFAVEFIEIIFHMPVLQAVWAVISCIGREELFQ